MQQPAPSTDPRAQQPYHQQQPWMVQQPPAAQPAAPPAGWAPQPVPPPQVQQYMAAQDTGSNEIKSLWIGDLQPYMDENYLLSCFAHTGEVPYASLVVLGVFSSSFL